MKYRRRQLRGIAGRRMNETRPTKGDKRGERKMQDGRGKAPYSIRAAQAAGGRETKGAVAGELTQLRPGNTNGARGARGG